LGELILTSGLVLMLFVGYKALIQDSLISADQVTIAKEYGNEGNQKKFIDSEKV